MGASASNSGSRSSRASRAEKRARVKQARIRQEADLQRAQIESRLLEDRLEREREADAQRAQMESQLLENRLRRDAQRDQLEAEQRLKQSSFAEATALAEVDQEWEDELSDDEGSQASGRSKTSRASTETGRALRKSTASLQYSQQYLPALQLPATEGSPARGTGSPDPWYATSLPNQLPDQTPFLSTLKAGRQAVTFSDDPRYRSTPRTTQPRALPPITSATSTASTSTASTAVTSAASTATTSAAAAAIPSVAPQTTPPADQQIHRGPGDQDGDILEFQEATVHSDGDEDGDVDGDHESPTGRASTGDGLAQETARSDVRSHAAYRPGGRGSSSQYQTDYPRRASTAEGPARSLTETEKQRSHRDQKRYRENPVPSQHREDTVHRQRREHSFERDIDDAYDAYVVPMAKHLPADHAVSHTHHGHQEHGEDARESAGAYHRAGQSMSPIRQANTPRRPHRNAGEGRPEGRGSRLDSHHNAKPPPRVRESAGAYHRADQSVSPVRPVDTPRRPLRESEEGRPIEARNRDFPRRRIDQQDEEPAPAREARRTSRRPASPSSSARTTEDCLESMLQGQQQLISVMQAPTVILNPFNGNPLDYFHFITAFEENVEKPLSDNKSRLVRLDQLCVGEAHEAIKCCINLTNGYARARRILKQRFGDELHISDHWIRKLVEGPNKPELQCFSDDLRNCFEVLASMGETHQLESQIAMNSIVAKLPQPLQNRWYDSAFDLKKARGVRPRLIDFVEFVERAAERAAETSYARGSTTRRGAESSASRPSSFASAAAEHCHYCAEDGHRLQECGNFGALTAEERHSSAMRLGLCFVCLQPGHMTKECPDKVRCQKAGCRGMHATVLHDTDWRAFQQRSSQKEEGGNRPPRSRPESRPEGKHAAVSCHTRGTKVALPLLPVRVTSRETGKTVDTYALLDTGSNITLCQERLFEALGVDGRTEELRLTTLEKAGSPSTVRVASLHVSDLEGTCLLDLPNVYARPDLHLSKDNLVTEEEVKHWAHLRGLPLHHAEAQEVTLLIGQDVPDALLPVDTVRGGRGEPYAVRTRLGWTVSGPVSCRSETAPATFYQLGSQDPLLSKVARFWQVDTSGLFDQSKMASAQDEEVVAKWRAEIKHKDGHYTMPIPFREKEPKLPDNRVMAQKRLVSLGRKLSRHDGLREQYVAGMEQLLEKGFAVPVTEEEQRREDGKVWYLPHHPVPSSQC